jgi:hypothetical protein
VDRQTEDLARRSAIKVVTAANTAIRGAKVVTTCRLSSGDTILTFKEAILKTAI